MGGGKNSFKDAYSNKKTVKYNGFNNVSRRGFITLNIWKCVQTSTNKLSTLQGCQHLKNLLNQKSSKERIKMPPPKIPTLAMIVCFKERQNCKLRQFGILKLIVDNSELHCN